MGYVLFTPNEFQLLPIVLDNSTDESLFPLHLHFVDEIVSKYQDAAHWYLLKIEGTKNIQRHENSVTFVGRWSDVSSDPNESQVYEYTEALFDEWRHDRCLMPF